MTAPIRVSVERAMKYHSGKEDTPAGADTQFVEVTPERLALLKRLVTDPTLVSDGTLRITIANEFGWRIDGDYFTATDKPWGHGYAARTLAERIDELEAMVGAIRGHLVL